MANEHVISTLLLLVVSLLALVLVLSKGLHDRPKLNAVLSEPGMVLLVGISVSLLVRLFASADYYPQEDNNTDDANDNEEEEEINVLRLLFSFPKEVFFLGFLPPILFNSGYELQRELFFRHIKAIVSFAVVGTLISGFSTGFILYGVGELGWFGDFDPALLELLTFGALIAATDTVSVLGVLKSKQVDPHLFNLVFGESALNDAVALVLFNSLSKVLVQDANDGLRWVHEMKVFVMEFTMIALGSPILGIIFTFFTALIFKMLDFRQHRSIELCLYILLMYIPYMLAEAFHLSGIVTVFFSGMSARRYIEPNISPDTGKNAEAIFKSVAYLAETCIFLVLGLSCFGYIDGFQWKFIAFAFVSSLVGRALSIYPICILYNYSLTENMTDPLLDLEDDRSVGSTISTGSRSSSRSSTRRTPERRKDREIPARFMHVLWFAGLRGAVAYACARNFPNVYGHENDIVTTTMVIVLINVLVMGGFTEYLLDFLNIRMGVDEEEYMRTWRKQRTLKGTFHRLEKEYIFNTVVRPSTEAASTTKSSYKSPDLTHDKMMEFIQIHNDAMEGADQEEGIIVVHRPSEEDETATPPSA
eukprot:scaffold167_cov110-Cylindrotheca_fusiformis.AAC.15